MVHLFQMNADMNYNVHHSCCPRVLFGGYHSFSDIEEGIEFRISTYVKHVWR